MFTPQIPTPNSHIESRLHPLSWTQLQGATMIRTQLVNPLVTEGKQLLMPQHNFAPLTCVTKIVHIIAMNLCIQVDYTAFFRGLIGLSSGGKW